MLLIKYKQNFKSENVLLCPLLILFLSFFYFYFLFLGHSGLHRGYRWLCLFRFKIWWMIPRVGKSGSEIPIETQLVLLEAREDAALDDQTDESGSENTFYILLLPVLDGEFRTSLQGNSRDELEFCVESGGFNSFSNQTIFLFLFSF